jgi:hypothetical protein
MDGKTAEIGEPWIGPDGEEFALPQDSHPACRCSCALQESRVERRAHGVVAKDYDESQHPRDERGRWSDSGGSALDVTDNLSVAVSSKVSDHDADVVKRSLAVVPNEVLRAIGPADVMVVDVLRDARGKRLPYAGLCQWDVEGQKLHIEIAAKYWKGDADRMTETVHHELGHALQRSLNVSNSTAHWEDEGAQARASGDSVMGRARTLFPHYATQSTESFAQGVAVYFSRSASRAETARHYREAFPHVMANVESVMSGIKGAS